jgi:hypothetical protein
MEADSTLNKLSNTVRVISCHRKLIKRNIADLIHYRNKCRRRHESEKGRD